MVWIFVPLIQVVEHRLLQRSNGRVTSTPDAPFGHFGEQSFYEIQPTATGRGEVDVISGVARQPGADLQRDRLGVDLDLGGKHRNEKQQSAPTVWERADGWTAVCNESRVLSHKQGRITGNLLGFTVKP